MESEETFFRRKMRRIAEGKDEHPVMMTQAERHEATAKTVKRLKFNDKTLRFMAACTKAMKGILKDLHRQMGIEETEP